MSDIYTTLVSDTFHRANESPLNPAVWTNTENVWATALQIVSDECVCTQGGPNNLESVGTPTSVEWPDNQWAQVQVDACVFVSYTGFNFASVLLGVRGQNPTDGMAGSTPENSYILEIDGPLGSGCQVFLYMIAAGNPITFFVGNIDGTPAVMTINQGDIVRLEMFGNQLTFKINGNTVGTFTDNTYAHGKPTIKLFGDTQISDAQVSNFSGGLISSSPTGSRDQSPNAFGTEDYGPGINSTKTSVMGTNRRTLF